MDSDLTILILALSGLLQAFHVWYLYKQTGKLRRRVSDLDRLWRPRANNVPIGKVLDRIVKGGD